MFSSSLKFCVGSVFYLLQVAQKCAIYNWNFVFFIDLHASEAFNFFGRALLKSIFVEVVYSFRRGIDGDKGRVSGGLSEPRAQISATPLFIHT